jgi:lysophospholipase L1-like esterase
METRAHVVLHLARVGRRALPVAGATLSLLVLGVLASCSATVTSTMYYVSLGDSYAVGYQPAPTPGATSGYTAVVAADTHLTLANFGCAGATSASIEHTPGCSAPYGPPAAAGAVAYPGTTQAAAAEAFIRAHHGHVGLVTVTIGGNDITRCATNTAPVPCFTAAIGAIQRDVADLASALRSAAGPQVPIVGLTYPDVLLGLWVYPPGAPNQSLATLSVSAFKSYVNPALSSAYTQATGIFVDVTAATGAYTALSDTTDMAPYGTIPTAVARVCQLTWYCSRGSIHANSDGYALIGRQIVQAYTRAPHP